MRTRREPDRIAFIAEEADWSVEEGDIFTGRFFGHVETLRPREAEVVSEFEDLDLASAVAWGRQHAPAVLVRVGLDEYDAGAVGSGVDGARPWPDAGIAVERRSGLSDRPGRWLVRGAFAAGDADDRALAVAGRDAIAKDDRATHPEAVLPGRSDRRRPGLRRAGVSYGPIASVTFEVSAASRAEALACARSVGDAALGRLGWRSRGDGRFDVLDLGSLAGEGRAT